MILVLEKNNWIIDIVIVKILDVKRINLQIKNLVQGF